MRNRSSMDAHAAFADYLRRRVPATNTVETQNMSLSLYRLLSRGIPVLREVLAAECGVAQERVNSFLRELPRSAVILDDRDRRAVIAFNGLNLAPTPHRFAIGKTVLYTWCAFDALFLPEILGKSATLITRCPATGTALTFELAPGKVLATQTPDCVLSIVTPDEEACCGDIRAAFCDHVNLFKDAQTFKTWAKGRQSVACVTLEEGQAFARQRNALRFPVLAGNA